MIVNNAPRVLVVEDEHPIREVVVQVLTDSGYDVDAAENGQDALDQLQKGRTPNLVLLDLRLPDMDAATFTKKYRQMELDSGAIVLFTAASATEAAEQVEQIGASGFLLKPFDLDALLDVVGRQAHRSGACAA